MRHNYSPEISFNIEKGRKPSLSPGIDKLRIILLSVILLILLSPPATVGLTGLVRRILKQIPRFGYRPIS